MVSLRAERDKLAGEVESLRADVEALRGERQAASERLDQILLELESLEEETSHG